METATCSRLYQENDGLLRVKLQSRHITSKVYQVWIQYDSDQIKGWFCRCKAGARTVGTCSHVAAVLWYLGQALYSQTHFGVKDWGQFLDDSAKIPETVDSSDSDTSISEE